MLSYSERHSRLCGTGFYVDNFAKKKKRCPMRKFVFAIALVFAACSNKHKDAFLKQYEPGMITPLEVDFAGDRDLAFFCSIDDIRSYWLHGQGRENVRAQVKNFVAAALDENRCKGEWASVFGAPYPKIDTTKLPLNSKPIRLIAADFEADQSIMIAEFQNLIVSAGKPITKIESHYNGSVAIYDYNFIVDNVVNANQCVMSYRFRQTDQILPDGSIKKLQGAKFERSAYRSHPLERKIWTNTANEAARKACAGGPTAAECRKERGAISTACMRANFSIDEQLPDGVKTYQDNQYCGAFRRQTGYSKDACPSHCAQKSGISNVKACLADCAKCYP